MTVVSNASVLIELGNGLLDELAGAIKSLRSQGFRFSDELVARILEDSTE